MQKFSRMKKVIIFCIALFICFFIYLIKIYISYDPKKLVENIEYSQMVYDRNGELLSVYLDSKEEWHFSYQGEIPENLKTAVLIYEDKKFYSHYGVDYLRIIKSFANNILGKKKMGASTISMQVVKLLEPVPRTYLNKIFEIVKTFKLENNFSKDEILKIYLNNVSYGSNIKGYSTAIRMYFNKDVKDLSYSEAALLAVLPNSPGILNLKKNNEKLLEKRNFLLKRLFVKKILDERKYKFSLLEKLPNKIFYFKNKSPQFSYFLKTKYKDKTINSTLDFNLQQKVEKIAKDYSREMKNTGINNVSVLVINNKTKEVRAYLASQDFEDKKNNGEIDGLQAKRSPGSLLKPFLYALAIDEGLITNKSLYPDVPIYFNNFYPKNSDKTFSGMTQMENALIKSLNIPFVKLLSDYGVDKFYYFLENLDRYKEEDFKKYGLSLILGTREMRAVDIAKLYVALANFGEYSDFKYILEEESLSTKKNPSDVTSTALDVTHNDLNESSKFLSNKKSSNQRNIKIFSKGASYITLDTLSKVVRPEQENLYILNKPISWKTGTSYGLRDAWSVGVSPDWTVLVWLGNFDTKPIYSLSGVETAGKLLFKIFNLVDPESKNFVPPQNSLKKIEIDKKTGYRKFYNVETEEILYPSDAKTLKISPYYKKIFVDENGNHIDSRDESFSKSIEKIIIEYPVEVSNYYLQNGVYENKEIKIAYPTNNLTVNLPKDFDKYQKIGIKLYNPNNEYAYWYIDNNFIEFSNENEKFFDLGNGEHKLTIVSENGKIDEVKFKIVKR